MKNVYSKIKTTKLNLEKIRQINTQTTMMVIHVWGEHITSSPSRRG